MGVQSVHVFAEKYAFDFLKNALNAKFVDIKLICININMHWIRNQHNVNTIIMSIPVFRKHPSTLILYINFILIDMCMWNTDYSSMEYTLFQN